MSGQHTVDLSNCDREPIHIPGSIQPHGVLLALDGSMTTVLRHSTNAAHLLDYSGPINGATLETLVGARLTHDLRNALAGVGTSSRPALLMGQQVGEIRCDLAVHRFKGSIIVEIERSSAESDQPLQLARTMIERISRIEDIDRLVQYSARQVRASMGYDRVMIYRFENDGAGKVVSESRRADLESFLGQYFPASDIPKQARALYLQNTIRIISSSRYNAVPVEPVLDRSGEPLDLSFAHLRSVSPIHLEYLRNMGVGASMSISIIIDGQLWGLIACHHYEPRVLGMPMRVAAEMFGEFFSLHLGALLQRRRLDAATLARSKLDALMRRAYGGDINEILRDSLPELAELVPSDGFGLLVNGAWSGSGATPPPSEVPALARHVAQVAEGRVWGTHALLTQLPEAERYYQNTAGVLAIPLSQLPRDYLLFFRRELVQTLDWAGNPEKSYETGPMGDRLTPRKSFEIWKQEVHGQAQPWTEAEREIAEAIRTALVEIVLRQNELLADERAKAEVRQRMLNEELNHRVKNILAVIKSLVGQPVREGRSLVDYVTSLKGRIQALSFAHDQVIRGDGGGQFRDLVEAEVTPYRSADVVVSVEGPRVWLDARAFSVMALVLHELATNAAKYGALSRAGGQLNVRWRVDDAGSCLVDWVESGGPAVTPPEREGFGTYLLDRSVPYDLGGTSDVRFGADGLEAHFCLPSRNVARVAEAAPGGGGPTALQGLPDAVAGIDRATRLLVLEDQMLIAMDIESALLERGFGSVTVTSSVREALSVLDSVKPQAAVLDINLGDSTSLPVAEDLRRRGVPFVFATGYADGGAIPARFSETLVVRKPYDVDSVIDALARAIADGTDDRRP